MIPSRRQWFNQQFSEEKCLQFYALLESRCGEAPAFPHSETPVFLPTSLVDTMARYGKEMVSQLLVDAHYRDASDRAIPSEFRVPDESWAPLFVQADFGLDANLQPKLVEIQGFPSLYAYQTLLAVTYRDAYDIPDELHLLPAGLNYQSYYDLLNEAIVGRYDPENVVLLEIDPEHQKTRQDFRVTEEMLGVRAVDISSVVVQGKRLYYSRDGQLVPIHRIYNRTIVDELQRKGIEAPFDWRDELAVEWAGHPNWFFRLSKFSLPYLKHKAVPRTVLLSDAGRIPDPDRFVLKPLYSFAGTGVIVGPTQADLDAVPAKDWDKYILQQRVDFAPVIDSPHGGLKIEVRIMYLWREGALQTVNTIIRMGKGLQMGVDHNKGLRWVGASAAFLDDNAPWEEQA